MPDAPSQHQCPNCGDSLGDLFASTRMANYTSCGTTLFLEDSVSRKVGEQGEMHEVPMLMALSDHVELLGHTFHLVGRARFSYGPRLVDEFWGGNGAWHIGEWVDPFDVRKVVHP